MGAFVGSAENLVGRVLHEQGLGKYCDTDFVRAAQRELAEAFNLTQEEMDRAAHEILQAERRRCSLPYLHPRPSLADELADNPSSSVEDAAPVSISIPVENPAGDVTPPKGTSSPHSSPDNSQGDGRFKDTLL